MDFLPCHCLPEGLSEIISSQDVFTRPSARLKQTGFNVYLQDLLLPYRKVGLYEDHKASKPRLVSWKFFERDDPLYLNIFEVGYLLRIYILILRLR
jgi:hypothetical protein